MNVWDCASLQAGGVDDDVRILGMLEEIDGTPRP